MQGAEFLEYLELQDNLDMITKSELLVEVRRRGNRISDRQLTTYISEGIIPESARIGSRSGAYPKIIADLVSWVSDARERGLSLKAIKELVPIWRFLVSSCRKRELSLAELEYRARQQVTLPEAAFAIPVLLLSCLPCPMCESDDLSKVTLITNDGERVPVHDDSPVAIDFVMWHQDEETEQLRKVAHLPLPLTMPREDPRFRVVLGVPNGVELPAGEPEELSASAGESEGAGPESKEV